MNNWYQMRERGAGKWRIELLWLIYRVFGINILKCIVSVVSGTIVLFAPRVRSVSKQYRKILNEYEQLHDMKQSSFSTMGHVVNFACSVVDKMSAICDTKTPLLFDVHQDSDWKKLEKILNDGTGVFFICSHLGNIETLSAMPAGQIKRMHAFMNVGQNHIFRDFMTRHAKYTNTVIHPTENIDVAMAGDMYDALAHGELVLMAGDRVSPNVPTKTICAKMFNHDCDLPLGVFRFAKACDFPVFAIVNVKTAHNKYKIFVKQLDTSSTDLMAQIYIKFIESMTLKYPKQWFNFFDFFKA